MSLRETLVQQIDGLTVRPVRAAGLWHVWERLSDGVQVHASMGDRAWVNGPEHSGFYQWTGQEWKREHGPWGDHEGATP